jgi:hypothetical protein
MLYYVKSGTVSTSTKAKSHKEAAMKTFGIHCEDFGICVVVSEKEIHPENHHSEVYFLTESISEECGFMRVVS